MHTRERVPLIQSFPGGLDIPRVGRVVRPLIGTSMMACLAARLTYLVLAHVASHTGTAAVLFEGGNASPSVRVSVRDRAQQQAGRTSQDNPLST